eukprot:SM015530S01439  [mRNA]  locus=s15530:24:272:+ [translate_table: standard]
MLQYRDCQRNHAVASGGYAVDGCCEFTPGGEEGSAEALRCAACECHRSFHRLEVEGAPPPFESPAQRKKKRLAAAAAIAAGAP